MTSLVCIRGCEQALDPFDAHVSCPSCGGLLEVQHDVAALQRRRPDAWHRLLSERAASNFPLDRSGVWAYREWVMPGLSDADVVSAGEGRAPLVEYTELADRLSLSSVFIKQCGHGLTGSFKDLGMTVLVSMANAMKKRGATLDALVCASTGDTSAALAAYGARARIPVVVLLPAGKVTPAQLVQPLAHGARVLMVDGDFDDCMRVVQQVARVPGMWLANSKNPLRLEGQKCVAFELAWELGWAVPDFVLVPSGNLGNVSALASGFALLRELGLTDRIPRLVACQVDAANPLYRAWQNGLQDLQPIVAGDTLASAIRIGDPVSWPRARRALLDSRGAVTSVSETELLRAQAEADRCGFFTCPHTAAALAGIEHLVRDGIVTRGSSLVVISTAHGLKFTDAKANFHAAGAGGDDAMLGRFRNPPLRIAASVDEVRRALDLEQETP